MQSYLDLTLREVLCLLLILNPVFSASTERVTSSTSAARLSVRTETKTSLPASRPKHKPKAAQASSKDVQTVAGQSSTLLPDGTVLLIGGEGPEGPLSSATIKNPATGETALLSAHLNQARAWHTATLLPDGSVLVLGGSDAQGKTIGLAEILDSNKQSFESLPSPGLIPRSHHSANVLTDGRVFVTGGMSSPGDVLGSTELWDFKSHQGVQVSANLLVPRRDQSGTLLADGTVLMWGGKNTADLPLDFGEIFDPAGERFSMETKKIPADSKTDAPRVSGSIPEDGAKDVPLDTQISLRFSKLMQVQTVNSETVHLTSSQGDLNVKVVPAESGRLVFLSPQSVLLPSETYTLTVSGAVDATGVALPDTQVSFTTVEKTNGNNNSGTAGVGVIGANSANPVGSTLPPLQAPPGVTALSGRSLTLDGGPLDNVTLRIDDKAARTDGTGRFLLKDLASGHHALVIDGRSAGRKGATYGVFEAGVDIKPGMTNVLDYTIWMTQLDTAHAVKVPFPTTAEVVITNPLLPGLEFHIPPNTTITDIDGNVASEISITPVPIKQPPFPLPTGVQVPIYFTIQPGGGYISVAGWVGTRGAKLIYPNTFHDAANTLYNFWNYDADEKGWFVYGQGRVSEDQKSVIPNPGVEIYELSGAMVANPGLGPQKGPNPGGSRKGGDPVDLGTGLLVYQKTDLSLSDVSPLSLTRTYRQSDSTSRAFGNGTSHNYDIFLVGSTVPYTYQELILADGGRIRFDRISTGTNFNDAVYQANSTPGCWFGAQIKQGGPAFWTLTKKDGTVLGFPESDTATRSQQAALLFIQDRNGNTVNLTRDSSGNLTRITSPNGRWIQLTYDTSNRVTQAQDNIGRIAQYSYNANGYLGQVIDANGGLWQYGYDSSNRMSTITDARNILYLQNQYDGNDRVVKQIQADNTNYQFSYISDGNGNITQTNVTDPRNNVRQVFFNPTPVSPSGYVTGGYASSDTSAQGSTLQATTSYQSQAGTNLLNSSTDALGRTTTYTYDALGNLTSVTRLAGTPNAVTTSFTYDATYSHVTSVTDPLGHTTQFNYDSKGNLSSITNPLGNRSTFTYNSMGQILSTTNPNGNTTQFGYSGGDLVSITDPLGRSVTEDFDSAGRVISVTSPLGQAMSVNYNPLDQATTISNPLGGLTSFGFDGNGNLLNVTDANNHITQYTYDNMDRVATRQDPLLNQESYQYDANGNLIQFTDRRGKVTIFSFDALNRIAFAGYGMQAGPTYESTVTYTFDAGNRLTKAVDSVSGTITRSFDGLDHLSSDATPQGTVSYTYDAAGRRASLTVPGQALENYTFDNANRLTEITQGTTTVQFSYDNANRRTTLTLPNGIVASYSYDSASQLAGITYQGGSTTIGNLAYSYDLAGRRTSVGGSFARTGLPNAVTQTVYNANNQLTTWGTANLFYDLNGNMTSDGTHAYAWDARDRLSTIDSGNTASFVYDPLGRRATKNILGTATNFLYDASNVVQEVIGGANTANSFSGGLDEVFQRTDSAGARSFLTDALGSTISLTDSTGTVQTSYTFEPFGNTTVSGSGTTNSFAYTGREFDAGNLYYYRARYYNPQLGRFISEDPLGLRGGINPYSYVEESPANFSDPFGLQGPSSPISPGCSPPFATPCGPPLYNNPPQPWQTPPPAPKPPAFPPANWPGPGGNSGANPGGGSSTQPEPPMPGRKSPKNYKVKKCTIEAVGPGYCTYKCDDGTTTVDPSCVPVIYPPADEPW